MTKDPSAIVLPFGKHKGLTVAEVLACDPAYADWVMSQGWLAERFAEIHAALATRGAGNDDTPEHNQLQARFLDHSFSRTFLRMVAQDKIGYAQKEFIIQIQNNAIQEFYSKDWNIHKRETDKISAIRRLDRSEKLDACGLPSQENEIYQGRLFICVNFEVRGVDVVIKWRIAKDKNNRGETFNEYDGAVNVELKPEIGDDYPTILRQMGRLGCKNLVAKTYNGRGVSEPVLKQIFEANGYNLIFLRDIEAKMAEGLKA